MIKKILLIGVGTLAGLFVLLVILTIVDPPDRAPAPATTEVEEPAPVTDGPVPTPTLRRPLEHIETPPGVWSAAELYAATEQQGLKPQEVTVIGEAFVVAAARDENAFLHLLAFPKGRVLCTFPPVGDPATTAISRIANRFVPNRSSFPLVTVSGTLSHWHDSDLVLKDCVHVP